MANNLVLYGSGNIGIRWLQRLGEENVYAFADSDERKIGKKICGKDVISVSEIKKGTTIFISTSYAYKQDIYRLLEIAHLNELVVGYPICGNIFLDWNSYADVDTFFEGRNALLVGGQLYGCSIGFASYISANTILRNVKVGRYTSIGPNVRIIVGQHPTSKFVSTHPIFYSTQQTIGKSYVSKNIFDEFKHTKNGWTVEIGNDVWIGDSVTIMEGVNITDGTIVVAGANVVKDTEPYSIVGGNPAKLIRYRFDEEDINFLQVLRWWDHDENWIDKHAKYFDDIQKLKKMVRNILEEEIG